MASDGVFFLGELVPEGRSEMKRIGRMLLVCALLGGCGCIAADPDSPSTCYGPGSVLKDNTSDGAEEDG
jgi:hypothetical protein